MFMMANSDEYYLDSRLLRRKLRQAISIYGDNSQYYLPNGLPRSDGRDGYSILMWAKRKIDASKAYLDQLLKVLDAKGTTAGQSDSNQRCDAGPSASDY